MCPRNDPSSSSTAHPRPLAGSHSSLPSQVNSTHGRPSRWPAWQSIHPSTAMNRKLPLRSAPNSMKPGPNKSIASASHRSISTIHHAPVTPMLLLIPSAPSRYRRPAMLAAPDAEPTRRHASLLETEQVAVYIGQLAKLDEQRLKKALWNLYWRGSAAMRERIEAEIDPDQHGHSRHPSKEPADPEQLLAEVRDFVALARSGAYMAGDRRVSPRERSRWRLTFKRLVGEAQDGLRAQDATAAATALEQLIDLACETRHYDYFHSEDPMEAAGFVASDAVALLWARLQAQHGFAGFARRAAPQLIRWESRHGWTRSGWGRVSQKETSLASV